MCNVSPFNSVESLRESRDGVGASGCAREIHATFHPNEMASSSIQHNWALGSPLALDEVTFFSLSFLKYDDVFSNSSTRCPNLFLRRTSAISPRRSSFKSSISTPMRARPSEARVDYVFMKLRRHRQNRQLRVRAIKFRLRTLNEIVEHRVTGVLVVV